ncbi:MAG: hypothetical protein J7L07_10280, partial [Candidatus Odinarchaeota archaeon]|nr:hypothetical protein [Candidatus Odinarchaeota archaeon]
TWYIINELIKAGDLRLLPDDILIDAIRKDRRILMILDDKMTIDRIKYLILEEFSRLSIVKSEAC